jgi:hypothetical protein
MRRRDKKVSDIVVIYGCAYIVCFLLLLFAPHNVQWGKILVGFILMTGLIIVALGSILFSSLRYYFKIRNAKKISLWNILQQKIKRLLIWDYRDGSKV